LEVYYDAKGESTVQSPIPDLSPNTNTGAVSGHSPTLDSTDGIDSFKFNGSSQYVTGAHGLTTGSDPVHTISLWLNAVELTDLDYVVQLGQGGTSHQQSAIIFKDNKIGHAHWGSGVLSEVTIANNVWYHVVAVFTGGNGSDLSKHKIFINGEDGGVGAFPGSTDGPVVLTGTQLTLGRNNNQGGTPGNYFTGSIANFRLYSKALNADQVKELYDYQKDYFLGSKSQVTLYKGHLGVGVTEPSGQLELAGDERLQQYPPGPMTNYETLIPGHGVFCASASSTVYSTAGWKAFAPFDNSVLYWAAGLNLWSTTGGVAGGVYDSAHASASRLSPTTEFGEYLILELPYKIIMSKVFISARNSHSFKAPSNFTIYGSNNNSDWSTLLTVTGATPSQAGGNYYPGGSDSGTSTSIGDTTPYKYLAIVVSKAAGGSDIGDGTNSPGSIDAMMIANISYFGTPGPTTLDKGSLTLGRSLDVPRISRYDVDTETPRPEKLLVDFDTTVNNSPTDISGKGNHGSFFGDATYSPVDKAFSFDGNGDYIKTGGIGNDSGVWEHSVSLWFKLENISQAQTLWYIDGDDSGVAENTPHVVIDTTGRIRFDMWSSALYSPNNTIAGGIWYHMVTSLSATNNRKSIYINGTLLIEGDFTSDTHVVDANASLWIGSYGDATSPMTGKISNFKVYDVVLEPSEVKKLYNLGRTGRSMVISDTAVGIGKVPEAQLDVRGNIYTSGCVRQRGLPLLKASATLSGNIGSGELNGSNWYDRVFVNQGGCFDLATGRFHVPVAGYYRMFFRLSAAQANVRFWKNGASPGSAVALGESLPGAGGSTETYFNAASALNNQNNGVIISGSSEQLIYADVGDYLSLQSSSITSHAGGVQHNVFTIYFVG
jgi:hypothetical protein